MTRGAITALAALLLVACTPPSPPPATKATADVEVARDAYDRVERCGRMAREYFKQENGNGQSSSGGVTTFSNFSNHYNSILKKCYMLMSSNSISKDAKTGKVSASESKQLYDFNDNLDMGEEYHFTSPFSLMQCDMGGEHCTTPGEWDEWAKQYMERNP